MRADRLVFNDLIEIDGKQARVLRAVKDRPSRGEVLVKVVPGDEALAENPTVPPDLHGVVLRADTEVLVRSAKDSGLIMGPEAERAVLLEALRSIAGAPGNVKAEKHVAAAHDALRDTGNLKVPDPAPDR